WYLVAWCERVHAFRHFRADPVLEPKVLVHVFQPHTLFQPLGRAGDLLCDRRSISATVAMSARVARGQTDLYAQRRGRVERRTDEALDHGVFRAVAILMLHDLCPIWRLRPERPSRGHDEPRDWHRPCR